MWWRNKVTFLDIHGKNCVSVNCLILWHRNECGVSKKLVCVTVYNEEIGTLYLKAVHGVGGWTEMTVGVGDPKSGRGCTNGSNFNPRRKGRAWSRMESTGVKDARYDLTSLCCTPIRTLSQLQKYNFSVERKNRWPGRCNRIKRTATPLPSRGDFRK
jgi:hypothetical protein